MGEFTKRIIGSKPAYDLFWLGEPSRYNARDEALDHLTEGDLGGRYMALAKGTSAQDLFDNTIDLFMSLHAGGIRKYHTTGKMGAESIFCQAVQMTWIFTAEEVHRLESRIDELEAKIAALLATDTQQS